MANFDVIGVERDEYNLYDEPIISLLLGDPKDPTGLTPAMMFDCGDGSTSDETLLASIVQRTNGDVYANVLPEEKANIIALLRPEIRDKLAKILTSN
jgi:hypothetical protein